MTVRALFITFFLGLMSVPRMAAQTSTWWYPFGNAEATKRNPAATKDQTVDSLTVKWRTESLRNAPVVLAGGILSAGSDNTQQVVGMMGDTLVILTHRGMAQPRPAYHDSAYISALPFTTVLTGLFNTDNPSTLAEGKPNVIGIGVQRRDPGVGAWGFLADKTGKPRRQLRITAFNDPNPNNSLVAVYPVAAFRDRTIAGNADTAMALAVVSQNNYSPPASARMANSLRQYRLGKKFFPFAPADSLWSYGFAPRTYPQPPSLLSIGRGGMYDNYVGLSTATYGFLPPVSVPLPAPLGDSTHSNVPYSVDVRIGRDPRALEARVTRDTGTQFGGEAHSYFMKLYKSKQDTGVYFRLITENHDDASPGVPQLTLTKAEVAQSVNDGIYVDTANTRRNLGWSILVANLDGTTTDTLKDSLPNNTGDEIVAAYRMLNGVEMEDNRFYVFRYNTVNNTRALPFEKFAPTQSFSGRLMAAGDIVADAESRQEVVTAHGDTLSVWQLRHYTDEEFLKNKPFNKLWSHAFDSPIVSVAIADIDGDGDNDLIVCTERATYAIGKAQPKPFGAVTTDTTRYCIGNPVALTWNRSVGGGERGLRIILRDAAGAGMVLADGYDAPPRTNRYTVNTATLKPGAYRLILQDLNLPSLIDSSAAFTLTAAGIAGLRLSKHAPAIGIGDVLHDTVAITCVAAVRLQRSFNGSDWQDMPPSALRIIGQNALIDLPVECPPDFACGTNPDVKIYLRLIDVSSMATPSYDTVAFRIPMRPIVLTPDTGTARARAVTWKPSDFSCGNLSFALSFDRGATWRTAGTAATSAGTFSFAIAPDAIGTASLRVCCADGVGCDYARRDSVFSVELNETNLIVPNPFNPNMPENVFCSNGAAIIYRPNAVGAVTITIYDASRAIVRQLADVRDHQTGVTYLTCWDGKNSHGDIVANGTYICVIQSESSARIVLPIVVMKR